MRGIYSEGECTMRGNIKRGNKFGKDLRSWFQCLSSSKRGKILYVVLMIWQTWGPCKCTSFLIQYCRVLAWVLQMKKTQGPSRGTMLSWWGSSWSPGGVGTESRCTLPDGVRKCDFSSQWQRSLGKWLAHIKGNFLNFFV